MSTLALTDFLNQHQLPQHYATEAEHWFMPVIEQIAIRQRKAAKTMVVGINGCQGSGKTTLADLMVFAFEQRYQLKAVSLSVDDFYFTQQQRQQLAQTIHPLLATRGVPGTHDIELANKTLRQLKSNSGRVSLPRFNKALDDRFPRQQWQEISTPVDIVVLEGWCLGATAQSEEALLTAVNDLEADEDPQEIWRQYVNQQLLNHYPALFKQIDLWIMLKAPSFDCVYQWRLEQEQKLRAKQLAQCQSLDHGIMDDQAIARFIKFYQRITEHLLNTLPEQVDYLFELDQQRQIQQFKQIQHQLLIFTDMDGSLLDHYNYSHQAADQFLQDLEHNHIPVIANTSKTLAELLVLRESLKNRHPFIVENGAAVFIPINYFSKQPPETTVVGAFWVKEFVQPRQYWQSLLNRLYTKYEYDYISFIDADIETIMSMTGLDYDSADRASQRGYGEPVVWQGSKQSKRQFIDELYHLGAKVLEGGRFLHVSGHCDKGMALQWLLQQYQQQSPEHLLTTLAIGDSHNDIAMLEIADIALLIRSSAHSLPVLQRKHELYVSEKTSTKGWVQGVSQILDSFISPSGINLDGFNIRNHVEEKK